MPYFKIIMTMHLLLKRKETVDHLGSLRRVLGYS